MTAIRYRDVTIADSAMIADLFDRCFVETFGHLYAADDLAEFRRGITAQAFGEEIADPRFALRVAEEGTTAVGFTKLGPANLPVDTPPGTLELYQIYVLRPWQGQGIAQRLYDDVKAEARRRGAAHLQLSVYIDNHRARRFYDRRGFQPVGRYDFMVGSHADEDIVMRKAL